MTSDQRRSVLGAGSTATEPSRASSAGESPDAAHPLDLANHEDAVIESATAEITLVAGAIRELEGRLDRALSQLGHITAVRTTETEIGRLFVEAQRFTETALSKLEAQVADLLVTASAKARDIVAEAEEDAKRIRQQAGSAASAVDVSDGHENVVDAIGSAGGVEA